MTRDEKIAKARELRDRGLTYKEIGAAVGVAYTTARRWIDPQAAEDDRRRSLAVKRRYGGTCATCGARTNGSNGPGTAASECHRCHIKRQHDDRRWTPEAIVAAIRRWAAEHGRQPTAQPDWLRAGPGHPSSATVVREMGWNAAIAAAGFEPRSRHVGLDRAEIVRLYVEERLGCDTIAARFGVSQAAVYWHVRRAGVVRTTAEANLITAQRRAGVAA